MSRYIDADALKKSYGMANECSDCKTNWRDCQFTYTFTKMDFCGWIDDQPTADVIEHSKLKEKLDDAFAHGYTEAESKYRRLLADMDKE